MLKRFLTLISLLVLLMCTAGCSFSLRNTVEVENAPSLPAFDLRSTLIVQVDSIDGSRCSATVLEENSTYDADDAVYITFTTVTGNQALRSGDIITLTYTYVDDVSAIGGTPHITVEEVTILTDYTPPETEATE